MGNDSYSETGGIRFGIVNATFPFGTLRAYPDALHLVIELIFWRREFHLRPEEITSIDKARGLFSSGIFIKHSNPNVPNPIIFWTFNFQTLKKNLTRLGYEIETI